MFQPLFGLGLILGSLLVLVPKPTTGFTVKLLGNSNAFGEGPVVDPLKKGSKVPIETDVFPDPNEKSHNRENVPSSDEIYLENLSVAKPMTNDEIDAYLMRFGYLSTPVNGTVSGKDREAAVKEYQGFARLSPTGVVDPRTRKQMQTARCGLADPVSINKVAHFFGASKWPKKDLTYKIAKYSKRLSKEIIIESTKKAFKMWSDASQLTFKEVSENDDADIRLSFTPKKHGDGFPFDGPGYVLAHAFFPQSGEVHLEEVENWTIKTKKGNNLLQVLVHEIGHALGLGHSGVWNSIMVPYYTGYKTNLALEVDDIAGIQFLYGKPKPKPPTNAPAINAPAINAPTSKVPTTAAPRIFPCPFSFWAIMAVGNQTFGFSRSSVFKASLYGRYIRLWSISSMFRSGPCHVDAAAHNDVTGHTFLFWNRRLWRYTDQKLDKGFPKSTKRIIRAAIVVDGKLIAFSSRHIHYFDEDTMEDYVDGEVSIADEYPDLPYGIRSAIAYSDGSAYVFYTEKYYIVDMHTGETSEGGSCTDRGYK